MRRTLKTDCGWRRRRSVIIVECHVGFARIRVGVIRGADAGKVKQTQDSARIRVIIGRESDQWSRQVQKIINLSGQSAGRPSHHETISVRRIKRNVRCRRTTQWIYRHFTVHSVYLKLTTAATLLIGIIIQNVAVGLAQSDIGSSNQKPESLIECVVPSDNVHRQVKVIVLIGPIAERPGWPCVGDRRGGHKNPVGLAAETIVGKTVGRWRKTGGIEAKAHPTVIIAIVEVIRLTVGLLNSTKGDPHDCEPNIPRPAGTKAQAP